MSQQPQQQQQPPSSPGLHLGVTPPAAPATPSSTSASSASGSGSASSGSVAMPASSSFAALPPVTYTPLTKTRAALAHLTCAEARKLIPMRPRAADSTAAGAAALNGGLSLRSARNSSAGPAGGRSGATTSSYVSAALATTETAASAAAEDKPLQQQQSAGTDSTAEASPEQSGTSAPAPSSAPPRSILLISSTETPMQAFRKLIEHGVQSAPVVDHATGRCAGLLDLRDLVSLVVHMEEEAAAQRAAAETPRTLAPHVALALSATAASVASAASTGSSSSGSLFTVTSPLGPASPPGPNSTNSGYTLPLSSPVDRSGGNSPVPQSQPLGSQQPCATASAATAPGAQSGADAVPPRLASPGLGLGLGLGLHAPVPLPLPLSPGRRSAPAQSSGAGAGAGPSAASFSAFPDAVATGGGVTGPAGAAATTPTRGSFSGSASFGLSSSTKPPAAPASPVLNGSGGGNGGSGGGSGGTESAMFGRSRPQSPSTARTAAAAGVGIGIGGIATVPSPLSAGAAPPMHPHTYSHGHLSHAHGPTPAFANASAGGVGGAGGVAGTVPGRAKTPSPAPLPPHPHLPPQQPHLGGAGSHSVASDGGFGQPPQSPSPGLASAASASNAVGPSPVSAATAATAAASGVPASGSVSPAPDAGGGSGGSSAAVTGSPGGSGGSSGLSSYLGQVLSRFSPASVNTRAVDHARAQDFSVKYLSARSKCVGVSKHDSLVAVIEILATQPDVHRVLVLDMPLPTAEMLAAGLIPASHGAHTAAAAAAKQQAQQKEKEQQAAAAAAAAAAASASAQQQQAQPSPTLGGVLQPVTPGFCSPTGTSTSGGLCSPPGLGSPAANGGALPLTSSASLPHSSSSASLSSSASASSSSSPQSCGAPFVVSPYVMAPVVIEEDGSVRPAPLPASLSNTSASNATACSSGASASFSGGSAKSVRTPYPIVDIISQSDIVKILGALYSRFALPTKVLTAEERAAMGGADEELLRSVDALNVGTSPVLTVLASQAMITTLRVMSSAKISGIALVDAQGRFVGNTSGADLKLYLQAPSSALLHQPVGAFVAQVRRDCGPASLRTVSPTVSVEPTASLLTVIAKLTATGMHRVFVVDPTTQAPVAVISVEDVVKLLHKGAASRRVDRGYHRALSSSAMSAVLSAAAVPIFATGPALAGAPTGVPGTGAGTGPSAMASIAAAAAAAQHPASVGIGAGAAAFPGANTSLLHPATVAATTATGAAGGGVAGVNTSPLHSRAPSPAPGSLRSFRTGAAAPAAMPKPE